MSEHNSFKTNDKQDKSADRQQTKVPVYLTAALFLIMGIYAISITMIGPIMPSVIEDYQIRLSQGGLMTTAQSIGGMLAVLFVGIMAGRFKKTKLIIISFLVFGASLLLVSLSDIYAVLLVVFFVFGAGSRMADTLLNAYVSDLYNKKRGYYLNLLHMYFGIGALIGPIYVRFILEQNISWTFVFSLLGIISIASALLLPIALRRAAKKMSALDPHDLPQVYAAETEQAIAPAPAQLRPLDHFAYISRSPVIWLLCLIMILYLAHQASLTVWLPMYMETDLLVSPTVSNLALSVLWLGIILGRMASAYLTDRIKPVKIVVFGNLLAAISAAVGILMMQPVILIIGLGFAGLFNGATIPLLVTIASERYPEHTGTTSSMIFLSGTLATMIFPWLVGRIAESSGFQMALQLTWITLFVLFAAGLVLSRSLKSNIEG